MIKEIGIGVGAAVIIMLLIQGINLMPFFFFAGLILVLFYFTGTKSVSKSFAGSKPTKSSSLNFDNIGGQDSAKKELIEALEFIKKQDIINKMGIRPLKGILLMGPPGTGKTLLAKAAAGYTDSVFMAASGSEFVEMYAGVGAQRVRQIFQQATKQAKKESKSSAVIFIDEIDILGGKRGSNSSHLEYDQTLNQLLVEMDGIDSKNNIKTLVIGATNRVDILDPALVRPGRFDRLVNVELSNADGRYQILLVHSKNKPLADDVDLNEIAKETFGFSGAHLESVANEAAILAMREENDKICSHHFKEAIDKVMMGERLDRKPDKEQLWRIAVHETGHALISEEIRKGSVSSITTTSRGKALGYMRQIPEKDSYLYTKEFLEGQIAILLAGSKAEEILLGNRSTGAENDFQQAYKTAEKIISSGMSSLGVVSKENIPGSLLYDSIKEILKEQELRVERKIKENIDFINNVALHLVEKERISGEVFRSKLKSNSSPLTHEEAIEVSKPA